MKLREYQTPQVNKLIRQLQNFNEAALISAVGTGKTLVGAVVGDELIKRGIVKKVIVSAPFNTIVKEFPEYSGKKILSGSANNSQYLIGKIEQSPNIKTLIDVIAGNSSEFVSTSHHAMANHRVRTAVDQADDLSDLLLVIDEAHHCFTSDDEDEDKDGTLLGEIAEKIKDRGGKILYVTATPYRTVGSQTNLIFDPLKCNPVIRTIGEQMRDGYAPSLNTEYIHVRDVKLTNAGDGGVFGDLANTRISDPQLKTLLPRIVKQWRTEKYPKTILLVPAGNADHTAVEVKKYLEEISFPHDVAKTRGRKHPSVLISVGDSGQTIEVNGKEMTEIECDKASGGRVYDIVIGCRKFDEGTDVSSASHIFMVGLPSSVRLFHQRTGRVLRDKKAIAGYAEWFGSEWLDKSKVVFFAPVGKKTKAFDYKVGRQLLHCIFAAESYQEYCESLNASQNIRIAFENKHKKAKCEASREELEYAMGLMGNIELNELKDYSSNEFDELVTESLNPEMTVGERIDMIKSSDMTDAERVIALNNIVNHLPDDIKQSINWDAIVNSIVKSVKKKKVTGFDIPPVGTISDVFDDVLREFYHVKITTNTERAVQQVFSSLSGETFKEWAEKCSQFMGEEHAIMMCKQCIEYHNENGTYPNKRDENIDIRSLGSWLQRMKLSKNNSHDGYKNIFYPALLELANTHGKHDMFDMYDSVSYNIEMCKKVIDYHVQHGKYPSTNIRIIGTWLQNKRGKPIPEYLLKFSLELGHPDIFNSVDTESNAINKCINIINTLSTHGQLIDKSDLNWLAGMKRAKRSIGPNKWYQSVENYAINNGYPNLFDDKLSVNDINTCKEVIDYHKNHDQLPSEHSTDKKIQKLGRWVFNMRKSKQNNTDRYLNIKKIVDDYDTNLFDSESNTERNIRMCKNIIEYHEQHGVYPPKGTDMYVWLMNAKSNHSIQSNSHINSLIKNTQCESMFVKHSPEKRSIDLLNQVIEFYKVNNKYPTTNDDKRLAQWLYKMRMAKAGNSTVGVFYDILQKMADNEGISDIFDTRDGVEYSIQQTHKLINFVCNYKRYPKCRNDTPEGIKLCNWVTKIRRTTNISNDVKLLAAKANLPNMFNSNWKDDLK